jgi:hypothetical protein
LAQTCSEEVEQRGDAAGRMPACAIGEHGTGELCSGSPSNSSPSAWTSYLARRREFGHLVEHGRRREHAFFANVAGGLPVGRVGEVEDEAHAALAVLENGFINGTVVNADGGGRIA